MDHLKAILSICAIALGITCIGVLTDLVLGISISGLLETSNPDIQLLTVRSLEILLLILLLTKGGGPKLSKMPILIDLGIGSGLVLTGWAGSHLFDIILVHFGHSPIFSSLKGGGSPTLSFIFLAVFVGPLLEEIFFRAGMHKACNPKGPFEHGLLLLVSSLIFASLHLSWNTDLASQIPLFLMWTCCGLATMALYMLRKSLLPGFILHGGANAILFFL